jgi:L-asparaginase
MQYTASALSFMLQNLQKPVVLTGSVKAIGEGSDAKQNFIDSVIVACSNIHDVCIVFHGKIIKGCKARKVTNEATKITNEHLDVYSSINYHLIGEMYGKLEDNHNRRVILEKNYKPINLKQKLLARTKIFNDGVLLIKIYPGFKAELLEKAAKFNCVILEAFGPGNIPFMENSLVEKIEMLTKKNIPVFVTTQNPFGEVDMSLYEVGQKAGAIPCNDMTSETAIVKLMWIMGNFGKDTKTVKELMLKNFIGEIRQ